ncbi:MAG: glycosyltransferase [Pseudomonadota bacterium]
MHDKPLTCSVALCTYNGECLLQQQLDSLLAQTYLPDEIVVGDDASSDGTVAILQRFAARAAQAGVAVHLHCDGENAGFVENFSRTVARASGDVVFFCDQDDVWMPDKLLLVMRRFEREPKLLLACGDGVLIRGDGSDMGVDLFEALALTRAEREALGGGRAFDVLVRRSMTTGATAAFRRELAALALPVGGGWLHDEWFAAVAAAMGPFAVLDEPLIAYGQHGGDQVERANVPGWIDGVICARPDVRSSTWRYRG